MAFKLLGMVIDPLPSFSSKGGVVIIRERNLVGKIAEKVVSTYGSELLYIAIIMAG